MSKPGAYKVILTFNLKSGQAGEELRRSEEANSFPNMLTQQPGFINLELVKVDDSKTLSIQTWETEQDWWKALETVKHTQAAMPDKHQRPTILESRDFVAGKIERVLS